MSFVLIKRMKKISLKNYILYPFFGKTFFLQSVSCFKAIGVCDSRLN